MTDADDKDDNETLRLLQDWSSGDEEALGQLLQRDLPWIAKKVRQNMGAELRARVETDDMVQDAMVEILRYGPRFTISNQKRFRGLMAKIIENALRGQARWMNAQRRQLAKERPLDPSATVGLDPAANSANRPSVAARRNEREAWMRLALEMLDPEDREILLLRQYQELSYQEISVQLGVREDTARMRFQRALPRLAKQMQRLKKGDLDDLLE